MKTQYKFGTVFLIAFLLGSVITYTIAQSGNTFIISQGVYPHGVAYTVWVEGSTYYAKNAYGAIDYSGTNATTVIQNALDTLSASGGKIFLKSGNYEISAPILIPSLTLFEGEGDSTVLRMINGVNLNSILRNENQTAGNNRITIRNLMINGNKDQQSSGGIGLIHFLGVDYGTVESTTIVNSYGQGIYMESIDIYTTYNKVIGNTIINTKGNGIEVYRSRWTIVSNNHALGSTDGAGIEIPYVDNAVVIGNVVEDCQFGIIIGWNGVNPSSFITVTGNLVQGSLQDGIRIIGTFNSTIGDNIAYGNTANGFILYNSSYNTLTNNYGLQNDARGFYIASDSNYNIITSFYSRDNSVGEILDLGSNNRIHLSYNGTTWIP